MNADPLHGIYAGMSDTEYHAAKDILSSSGARALLDDTPAKFHFKQGQPQEYRAEFEIGRAAHTLATGEGQDFEVIDAASWQGKAAREQRDQALAEGRTPLLTKEFEQVEAMSAALKAHPTAGPLFRRKDTVREVSMYWDDPATGVACRARPDLALSDWSIIVDYKTTKNASPEGFAKAIADYGYHIQAAWYIEAVEHLCGVSPQFVFVAQEKDAPHLVGVYQLDHTALQIGRAMAAQAREIFRDCTTSGVWPGYTPDPVTLSLPAWKERVLGDRYL